MLIPEICFQYFYAQSLVMPKATLLENVKGLLRENLRTTLTTFKSD